MDGGVDSIAIMCFGGDGQQRVLAESFELQKRMGMVVDDGCVADGASKSFQL